MLHIDDNTPEVIEAKQKHFEAIRCLIWKKIGAKDKQSKIKKCKNTDCSICNSRINTVKDIPKELYNYLNDDNNLKKIIIGNPKEIISEDKKIWKKLMPRVSYKSWVDIIRIDDKELDINQILLKNKANEIIEILIKIIAYDSWFSKKSRNDFYSAYHLAEKLNRRSCTYCNRTYTTTMYKKNGGKLMRPQFDHWYPKSKYPLLALSFYNLIPSCSICNSSSKGATELNVKDHVHPYLDKNQTDNFEFNYGYYGSIDKYNISVEPIGLDNKTTNTLKELNIDTMYNAHHYKLKDLISIRQAYSDKYIDKMAQFFPKSGLTKNETYRFLFGTELNSKDFHKRPFSKFKYDILKELGIINDEKL